MWQLSHLGILYLFAVFVWGVSSRQLASRFPAPTSTSTTSTSTQPATSYNFFTNRWITTTTKVPSHPYPATSAYNYFTNQWRTPTKAIHPHAMTIPYQYSQAQWIDKGSVIPFKTISQIAFSSNSMPLASRVPTTADEKLVPNDATLLHQILIQETSLRVELQKTVWDLMKEVEQMKKNQMEEKSEQDIVNQQLINNITSLRSENKKLKDELSVLQQQAQNKSSNTGLHSYNDFTDVSKELQSFKREFRYFSLGFLDIQQDLDRINTQQENVTTAMKDIRDVKDILVRIQHKQFDFSTELENLKTNQTDMLARVAFTATLSQSQSFSSVATLVFSNILTNIGGGYNAVTGIFTAPLGGVYVFNCKLTEKQNKYGPSIHFVKNGAMQGTDVGNTGSSDTFRTSSSSIVLELSPGDRVWVKVFGVSSYYTKTINGVQILTGFLL